MHTHKYVHPLSGINTTVVDSPSSFFILLFIYKIKLVAFFYVLSCLTEIPTLTKNTHTYSIENCGSILTSFSFILSILEYFIYHFKNKKKKVKEEVTTFLYYKLTSTQSSSIVHHWC